MAILENLFAKGPILENFLPQNFPIYGIALKTTILISLLKNNFGRIAKQTLVKR